MAGDRGDSRVTGGRDGTDPAIRGVSTQELWPGLSRRDRLFADPLLTDRLLLVALTWDHLLTDAGVPGLVTENVTRLAGLTDEEYLRAVMADIPVYQPPERPQVCQHTGPRGGNCQSRVTRTHALRDNQTGEVTWLGSCGLVTHQAWAGNVDARHECEVPGPYPLPAYNQRSRVAGHFPEIDWPWWWHQITQGHGLMAYDQARDPDRGGNATPPRAALRLVRA